MNRYHKWNYITSSLLLSKQVLADCLLPKLTKTKISAGYYAVNQLQPEHGLIFSNLYSQQPQISIHSQGKRGRLAVALRATIGTNRLWASLDNFVNLILVSVLDLNLLHLRRSSNLAIYTINLLSYFETPDVSALISERLLVKQNIFIPLSTELTLQNGEHRLLNEAYLRMFRLPLQFYKSNYNDL
jgi:hypothetical protein